MFTHMPFLTRSLSGTRTLFYCQAGESFFWKVHVRCGSRDPFRIVTGFPEEMIECSPAAWQDETGWHVSFIAGGMAPDPLFCLYRMDGQTLDQLSEPVAIKPVRTGFIHHDRLVSGDMCGTVHVSGRDMDRILEFPGTHIMRLSYRADSPDELLVTCQWKGEETVCTVLYDLATDDQCFLECDGKPAYKPTLYGDELLYADRSGERFEERHIRPATRTVRTRCRLASRKPSACDPVVPVSSEALEQARSANLAGVEKHLGSAWTIATELKSGHAYRMRLVGHLNEAEEECLAYPNLHRMIRDARKAYQETGNLPNWEMLAEQLDALGKE
jgi:hypothetical protein